MRTRPAFRAALLSISTAAALLLIPNLAAHAGDEYETALDAAQKLIEEARYDDAIKELRWAEKLPRGDSYNTYWLLSRAYLGAGATKNVIQMCAKALELAPDDVSRARVHNIEGRAFSNDEGDTKMNFEQAEAEYRTAISFDPNLQIVHYNLGYLLLRENKDSEGVSELNIFLTESPDGVEAANARKLIATPDRARENYAPDFSFTTSDGHYISSDDLRDKVVMVEFWASWSHACDEAAETLGHISKRYAKDRFVVVDISIDRDVASWQKAMKQHHQKWIEYRDADGKLMQLFFGDGPLILPSFTLIDGSGVTRSYRDGWSIAQSWRIEDDVKKWIKMLPPPLNVPQTPPGPPHH
jgi:thiol-disulfide isomerase/thioredoxin